MLLFCLCSSLLRCIFGFLGFASLVRGALISLPIGIGVASLAGTSKMVAIGPIQTPVQLTVRLNAMSSSGRFDMFIVDDTKRGQIAQNIPVSALIQATVRTFFSSSAFLSIDLFFLFAKKITCFAVFALLLLAVFERSFFFFWFLAWAMRSCAVFVVLWFCFCVFQ